METWRITLRIIQLVLVVIAFFMSRFGLGFRVLQYGYGSNNELEPSLALKIGTSQDHWWLHTVLAYYIIILPSILLSEYVQPEAGKSKNIILTLCGSVLYIISGSATLNYYIPQVISS